jgi:phage-related protein
MANHTSGVGGSVSGVSYSNPQGPASKERYVYGILGLLEQEENSLTRIAERTDRITITANLSTKTAAIDLLLNVTASNAVGGNTTYTASHYLVGSTFTSGTSGNSTAPNLAQAAMEAVVALKLLELDPARKLNPDKTVITRCTHTMAASGGSNATFSALLEFPIEIISLPGGGSVIEGKVFLS